MDRTRSKNVEKIEILKGPFYEYFSFLLLLLLFYIDLWKLALTKRNRSTSVSNQPSLFWPSHALVYMKGGALRVVFHWHLIYACEKYHRSYKTDRLTD